MDDQVITMEFNEVSLIEGFNDRIQRAAEELEERIVRDVPGGDDQSLAGRLVSR